MRVGQDAAGAQWRDDKASGCALGLLQVQHSMNGSNGGVSNCANHTWAIAAGESLRGPAGHVVAAGLGPLYKGAPPTELVLPKTCKHLELTWCICQGWLKLGLQA